MPGSWPLALAMVAVLGAGPPSQAPSPAPTARAAFLDTLQRAVAADDRRAVATLVQYPITVLVSGFQVPIPDAASFVRTYDAVFTPDLRAMVAQSGMARRGQPPPKYPAQVVDNGMTIGAGFLWI